MERRIFVKSQKIREIVVTYSYGASKEYTLKKICTKYRYKLVNSWKLFNFYSNHNNSAHSKAYSSQKKMWLNPLANPELYKTSLTRGRLLLHKVYLEWIYILESFKFELWMWLEYWKNLRIYYQTMSRSDKKLSRSN